MKKKIKPFYSFRKEAYRYDRASIGANIAYENFCVYQLGYDEPPTNEGVEIYLNINILFWSFSVGVRFYGYS